MTTDRDRVVGDSVIGVRRVGPTARIGAQRGWRAATRRSSPGRPPFFEPRSLRTEDPFPTRYHRRTQSLENRTTLAVSWRAIAIAAAVLLAAWGFDVFVLRTTHLTGHKQQPALTPMYAFWEPVWKSSALVFVAFAAWFAWSAPRLADPERVSRRRFAPQLFAWAVVLPFALFLVRQSVADFGDLARVFRYSDLFQDAEHVRDVRSFLRGYVETMPKLSLHGSHFPPGPAIFVHLSEEVFGERPAVSGITVLVAFAAGIVAAYGALREIASERAARQGALLLLAVPSVLDHACTSIDALFMACASGVLWCALRAFRPGAHFGSAVMLGVVLLIATCVSFSTFPLGLAVTVFALMQWRTAWQGLLLVGATYLGAAWVLDLTTGFSIFACLRAAQEHAEALMGPMIENTARAGRAYRSYGNVVAFAIGSGVALVPAVVGRVWGAGIRGDRWAVAAVVTLGVMAFAPIYYMETERIWIFAMVWMAGIAVGGGSLGEGSMRRLIVAGMLQAVAMECLLFTFW
jgi:hypothetical protein